MIFKFYYYNAQVIITYITCGVIVLRLVRSVPAVAPLTLTVTFLFHTILTSM